MPARSSRLSYAALYASVLAASLHAQTSHAQASHSQSVYADLATIDHAIADFIGAAIGLPGGASLPVDRRLRLAACAAPLAFSWRDAHHDAVVVRCPDAGSWHLFVPVRAATTTSGGAIAVERGEMVTIAVTGDGFAVSQPGEAVEAGAVGDWIRVRTVKDGAPRAEPIRARIVRPGAVEVPLP